MTAVCPFVGLRDPAVGPVHQESRTCAAHPAAQAPRMTRPGHVPRARMVLTCVRDRFDRRRDERSTGGLAGGDRQAAAWAVKAVAIGIAGGLDRSPLEGPLVLLGFAFSLVAAAAVGVLLAASRPAALRVVAALVAMLVWFVVLSGLDAAVGAVEPADPAWVWEEVSLWIGALILLAGVAAVRARAEDRVLVG